VTITKDEDVSDISISVLDDAGDPQVRALLTELTLDEQEHYDHPRLSREDVEESYDHIAQHFVGENHVFVARNSAGHPVGLCWCVLFDPGTGLEGEVAELYVQPQARGQGIAKQLLKAARHLFQQRQVTFACVWTRGDNAAALAAYQAVGFSPTEQTVLTWLPLHKGH
jgi:ribosomal protein S18 acetylase RimI-like enzyme